MAEADGQQAEEKRVKKEAEEEKKVKKEEEEEKKVKKEEGGASLFGKEWTMSSMAEAENQLMETSEENRVKQESTSEEEDDTGQTPAPAPAPVRMASPETRGPFPGAGTGYRSFWTVHQGLLLQDVKEELMNSPGPRVCKEEVAPEQQEWSSSLDQVEPALPHIKEEQEELWISQEGEQLQGLEEGDITKFPSTSVPVKSEDDEEKPQPSQLHQSQTENREAEPLASCSTEQMKRKGGGEDCGVSEPARNLDHLQTTSASKTEDIDEWKGTSEPQSGLDSQKNCEVLWCSVCGKSFSLNSNLTAHMTVHAKEKQFRCSVCGRSFDNDFSLEHHVIIHTVEKPFKCLVCGKGFVHDLDLEGHQRVHTVEKPFKCLVCGKCFAHHPAFTYHLRVHRKHLKCLVCGKRFSESSNLSTHMIVHTEERDNFIRSVCAKMFSRNPKSKKRMKVPLPPIKKLFSCSVCGRNYSSNSNLKKHLTVHAGRTRRPFVA